MCRTCFCLQYCILINVLFQEAQVQRDKERLSKKLDAPKEGSMIPEQIK